MAKCLLCKCHVKNITQPQQYTENNIGSRILYEVIGGRAIETLQIKPRGDIVHEIDWNTNEVKFENGVTQQQGRYIEPDESWQVAICGDEDELQYYKNFFNARKGALEKFFCYISGEQKTVRFASKVSITEIREKQNVVGFKCEFSLKKAKK